MSSFKKVLPFGTTELLYQLYARIDIVLIGFLLGESDAGLYNVGYRVVFFLLFIPKFASIALFPIVSKMFHDSKFEFQKMYNKSLSMILIIGLPISAVLWLISPEFIELIFGSKFSESSTILRILAFLFVLNCISSIMEIFLMASDHQIERTKSYWYTTTVCTLLNICFILLFKIEGAALAVLLSSLLLVILLALKLRPVVGLPDVKSKFIISFFGVLIFSLLFSVVPSSIFIIIPGSILIYLAIIIMFKDIRGNEMRMVFDLAKRKRN